MNTIQFILAGMLAGLLGYPLGTAAEDIDIYSGFGGAAGTPNVLIVLDNATPWNGDLGGTNCVYADNGGSPSLGPEKSRGAEQCAIVNSALALPLGSGGAAKVNLGFMLFDNASQGGRLYQRIVPMDTSNRSTFVTAIKALQKEDETSGGQTGATMQEAWAYFMGRVGVSGRDYATIRPSISCENNFIIFITNTATQGKPADDADAKAKLAAAGANAEQLKQINATGTNMDENWADEWTRYMRQSADVNSTATGLQNIITYTIAVSAPSKTNDDYVAFSKSMAVNGGGRFFQASTADEIKQAILRILNEVQAVNSVFSSSSLPVSVNAQGTHLNQIFVGMFRPDEHASPRWMGNLKQYQLIYDVTLKAVRLADQNGDWAISSSKTGFITPNAVSFWTSKDTSAKPDDSITGGFYVNNAMGSDLDGQPNTYDSPDGEVVEKGGVAQQLRKAVLTTDYTSTPAGPRNVYTYCPSGTSCDPVLSSSVNAFATTNSTITNAMLGSAPPVSASIVRSGTTATVTTATAHGFSNGASVSISGATQNEYNGTFTIAVTSATEFTYAVPEYPPTPATGSYTASLPSASVKSVTSITRSGSTATVTLSGHGYTNGQSITISGATQAAYNGTFTISGVTADTFTYTVTVGPTPLAGSHANSAATAKVGSNTKSVDVVTSSAGTSGAVRSDTTLTVKTTSNHGFSTGNSVTLAGIADLSGTVIAQYNGTFTLTKINNRSFRVTISGTTPVSPATGTITADSTAVKTITSLTRVGTTATATSTAHGFSVSDTVNIGGTAGTNERAYVGTFMIISATADTFNYTVVVSPASPATGSITAAISTSVDRTALINWIRGHDNFGDEASPGNGITVRPSIHGDVLHSRPSVINYGEISDNPRVVAFYGANDGTYRAVNGNQTASIGSFSAGQEMWAFIPTEFFGKFSRLRSSSPQVKVPTTPEGIVPTPTPRDYFADGPTGVYQRLNADKVTTEKAYLYIAMRRGGRFMYALNVSDPAAPKFMWKKGCYPSGTCDTGYEEMGQTWSEPKVTRINGYPNPVLIFGAGYDPAEDVEPPVADTMGRGIFILDYYTGDIVWSATHKATAGATSCSGTTTKGTCLVAGMNSAIPADITLVDRNNDGKTERLYATDVGGNVWRVDLEPPAGNTPDNFRVYKFAALGCDDGVCAAGTSPRKFFYRADIIPIGKAGLSTSYDAVLLGSGDREHPLYDIAVNSAYNVSNRFYMLKDLKTVGHADTETVITQTATAPDGLFNATSTDYDGSRRGYYFTFATGEKVVNAPTTVQGFTFFGTNQPPTPGMASCDSKLGIARGYSLAPLTGKKTFVVLDGGGLPPTAVSGVTTAMGTDGVARQVSFCLGCTGNANDNPASDCSSSIGACKPPYMGSKKLKRTYWYNTQ
jgi:type IV pilus assembly protein PilY1